MPDPQKRLILANGEQYVLKQTKPQKGRPPEMPRTFDEARVLVQREVKASLDKIAALPAHHRLGDEAVLCLRLHPDMVAKTYDPESVFATVPELKNVGSRSYRVSAKEVAQTQRIRKQLKKQVEQYVLNVTGRLVFVRGNEAGFKRLLRAMEGAERTITRNFRESIQKIERFDLLTPGEQLLGFEDDWKEGRVELILHPSRHSEQEQTHFLKKLFSEYAAPWKKVNIANYPDGPVFVSCYLTRAVLDGMAGANPLRAAHPLVFGGLENLRGAPTFPAPLPPATATRSTVKVGMFDGGIDTGHTLLSGHAEQDESLSIKAPADTSYIEHGIAVAGALLHGPLNGRDTNLPLPPPAVSVVSIRTLPTSDQKDIDLYEAINVIENAVPARPDIKVFNISFGPRGPILDDTVSRFTYALDMLAATRKVAFFVAVGNDGEAGNGLDRIQSPSDMVNGMGIGAYTQRNGRDVHAPYSCKGPGRECSKMKPDLVAFGGCDQQPIHLVAAISGKKVLAHGTSFASPIAAALGAQTTDSFERGTTLLARALLIHTARHPDGDPDHLLGHGIVGPTMDDILYCNRNEVTIIFQGDLIPTKMVRLPVMLPTGINITGNVEIRWTIAGLPPVSPIHPSDYTACCIEDTFYPNDQVFAFSVLDKTGKQKVKRLHLKDDDAEIKKLLANGWKKSDLPATQSGNEYPTEQERRSSYKWEPIVRRAVSKRASSLYQPFLVLHAIPRNSGTARLDYAAIVTISAPKCVEDLYSAVLRRYPVLQPIRLRTEAELRVRI